MKQTPFKKKYAPMKKMSLLRGKSSMTSLKRTSFAYIPMMTPKKELDSIISRYVRLSSSDDRGMVQCVTCPKIAHWQQMQCGHFQRRSHMATRYYLLNLGVQCEECNCFNAGENKKFATYIDHIHGKGTADKIRMLAQTTVYDFDFEEQILIWGGKLIKLVESKNNQIQY